MGHDLSCRTCVYCGAAKATTDDHIPPKGLFPVPRPSTLVTVPACVSCNAGFSADDEYFKVSLLLRHDVAGQPAFKDRLDSLYRSWARPQSRRFAQAVFNSIRVVELRSQAGLFLGRAPAHSINPERVGKVIRRIVKGLHFHERNQRIPDDHDVHVIPWIESDASTLNSLPRFFLGQRIVRIGDVFEYTWAAAQDRPFTSIWLFRFYGKAVCLASVLPTQQPL